MAFPFSFVVWEEVVEKGDEKEKERVEFQINFLISPQREQKIDLESPEQMN